MSFPSRGRFLPLARWAGLEAYVQAARVAIRQAVCYPADIFIEFISYPFAFLGYFFFVAALFGSGGSVQGYGLSTLITYFSLGWVLRMIVDQRLDGNVAALVQSGGVVSHLVRPVDFLHYLFAGFVGRGCLRFCFYALPAILMLTTLFGEDISLRSGDVGWFILYALVAFRMAFELQMLLGLTAFFLTMNHQISWTVDMTIRLISGLIVPLNLFPEPLFRILELLPFQYLYFKPIQVFLHPAEIWNMLAGLTVGMLWTLGLALCNRTVFRAALRRHVIYGS
ncbi:ABC transporter permease [Desulfobulbus alkaliphilus]|uniref:ABC transporter permease n=1 Tax=Desulfobulbus alkaliphilus TaxID=869814 RepID=UPI0019664F3A|nr:ABC-2 family transporter protein [Desulfobulbus alkaliphilus]MBM9535992.1 ABC-2 family transporter protein [Desulfobulbus alkaliphilus]